MKDYLNLEGLIYFFNKLTGRFATKEELNDVEEKIVQSDWNQTDETQNDFIKNKPYEETEDDALELLAEMGVLEATVDTDGAILTDENNNILTV